MNKMIAAMAVFVASGLATQQLSAQEPGFTQETLVGGPVSHGGFGATSVRFGEIAGEGAVLTGGHLVWLVNHRSFIGLEGWGLASDNASLADALRQPAEGLDMGYGGITYGYIFQPSSLVHATARVLVGAGGVGYDLDDDDFDGPDPIGWDGSDDEDAFFVAEPSLGVEFNVAPFIRVGLGGSYRFVSDVEMTGLRDRDLGGFSGELLFRFGKF